MLTIKEIEKSYEDYYVIKKMSFSIQKGKLYGILGPNGAGKSTLMNIIVGLLKMDSGSVKLNGINLHEDPISFKKNIGFVEDFPNLYDYLTGWEYLNFLGDVRNIPRWKQDEFISELYYKFNIDNKLNNFIKSYSKGMRQKIAIMGALLHQPKLLILDEPFSGLDPISIRVIKAYLKEYVGNDNSLIFSAHILDVAQNICEEVIIVDDGKILASGDLSQLRTQANNSGDLEEIFYQITQKGV